jgi:hypothetical protein
LKSKDHKPAPDAPDLSWHGIIGILFLFFIIRIGLRWFGVKKTVAAIGRWTDKRVGLHGSDRAQTRNARRLARLVTRTNSDYSLFGNSCLVESIALWGLLRKNGLDARFCIGVRTLTGVFESHAWVEFENNPLNDAANVGSVYCPLDLAFAVRPRYCP